jgi:hypothetical protein
MRVGADIGSMCRKCGDVWHVVVAVVDGRIVKVECKQCGSRHRHRPPDGEAAIRPSGDSSPRRTRAARPRASAITADPDRPPRTYRPSEHYSAGDRVLHPRFGEGVVQATSGPTKVRVLFSDGEKTLVQARDTAS